MQNARLKRIVSIHREFILVQVLQGHVSDSYMYIYIYIYVYTWYFILYMNIILTSVQQNRHKNTVHQNLLSTISPKMLVLEAAGSFWPRTSPLIQHKAPAFSLVSK